MRGPMVSRAIERFETALELDPQYARAYAGLAAAHVRSNLHLSVPKELARSRAASFARRAIEIDDRLAEPYAVFGVIEADQNNWRKAIAYFEEAESHDPADIATLQWHAETLMKLGYLNAAKMKVERALAIDPNSPALHTLAGHVANNQRELDLADKHYRRVQTLGVDAVVFNRGLILYQGGEIEKAANLIAAAYVYFQLVPNEEAEDLSAMIERLMRGESTVESELIAFPTLVRDDDARAFSFLYAGQSEHALRTMESDPDGDHDTLRFLWSHIDPNLRNNPYFKVFARNIGMLDYWLERGWPDRCRALSDTGFECA